MAKKLEGKTTGIQRNRQGALESHFQKEELPQNHSKQEDHEASLTDGS